MKYLLLTNPDKSVQLLTNTPVLMIRIEIGGDVKMMVDPQHAPLILKPLEILAVDSVASAAVRINARIKTLSIKQGTWGASSISA